MIYKTLLGTTLVIAGITLAIVYLSIDHKHRVAARLSVPTQANDKSTTASEGSVRPALDSSGKQALASGGPCNIERMDGVVLDSSAHSVSRTDVEISGWLTDQATKSVPQDAGLRIEDKEHSLVWLVPIALAVDRPDVQASQGGEPAYRRSGFLEKIDLSKFSIGKYKILLQYQLAGHGYICDNDRSMKIGS